MPWWVRSRTIWVNLTAILSMAGSMFLADPEVIKWVADHHVLVAAIGSLYGAINIWLRGHPRDGGPDVPPAEAPK